MLKILLITSEKTISSNYGFGSSKDINYRISILKNTNSFLKTVGIDGRNDSKCLNLIKKLFNEHAYDVIIFEHAAWPASIKYVRKNFLETKILLRCHNEEILHSFDMLRAYLIIRNFGKRYLKEFLGLILRIFKTTYKELISIYYSHNLLLCNDKSFKYFSLFKNTKSIFFVNTHYDITNDIQDINYIKEKINHDNMKILVMGSEEPTIFNDHSAKLIVEIAKKIILNKKININIIISGAYTYEHIPLDSEVIKYIGVVKNPFSLISACDAVFLPTHFGRGIKTRIYDSIVLKTPILVHHQIKKNLPDNLAKSVSSWNGNYEEFIEWLNTLKKGDNKLITFENDDLLQNYRKNSNKELFRAIHS